MLAAGLTSLILLPWKKYSNYFDKNCWGVWGLSPILKYTLLFLALFFLPPLLGIVNYQDGSADTYFSVMVIAFLMIAFVWFIYLPILSVIVAIRAYKKAAKATNDAVSNIKSEPWKMTPKQLYTEPHMSITLYLFYLKDYFFDFIDWTTQFFPMSLLFVDKIKYPLSTKIRHNARHIEIFLATLKIPLKYINYEINMQNTIYKFEPYEQVKRHKKLVKKLDKGFYGSDFYIREEGKQIHIIDPHRQF